MKPAENSTALVLVNTPEWAVAGDEVRELQDLALAQIDAIAKMENCAAMGAILAGLTLHRVKASMPHGTFMKWCDQIGTSGANLSVRPRQARNYMRLSLVFLDSCKVQMPELLALPGDQLTLDLADGHDHNDFLAKLRKFAGSNSLNELLIKHGIKVAGLKKASSAKGAEDDEPPAKTPQELCMEILEQLALARKGACDHAVWMQMSRQQHDDLKAAFDDADEQIAALHAKTHGRAARANSKSQ